MSLAAGGTVYVDDGSLGVVDAVLDAAVGEPSDPTIDKMDPTRMSFGVRHDGAECWWRTNAPTDTAVPGVRTLLDGTGSDSLSAFDHLVETAPVDTAGIWVLLGRHGVDAGWALELHGEGLVDGGSISRLFGARPGLDAVVDHAGVVSGIGACATAGNDVCTVAWSEPIDHSRLSQLVRNLGLGELDPKVLSVLPERDFIARYEVWLSMTGVQRVAIVESEPSPSRLLDVAGRLSGDLERVAFVEAALGVTAPGFVEIELTADGVGAVLVYPVRR